MSLFELYNLCASVPENYIACQVGLMLMVIFMSICFHSSDVFALLPLHCVTFQVDASLTLLLLLLLLVVVVVVVVVVGCWLLLLMLLVVVVVVVDVDIVDVVVVVVVVVVVFSV